MERLHFTDLRNYIFGSTAAIVTNISLIVGLGSARSGKGPILGGLLTIALADNISDSLGIHMYKETEGQQMRLSLLSTVLNFCARLVVSLSFVAIVLALPVPRAVLAAIAWGLLLLAVSSYLIARRNRDNPALEIVKHVLVAVVVVALSYEVGYVIIRYF